MRKTVSFIIMLLLIAIGSAYAERKSSVEAPELSIECRIPDRDFYEREPIPVVITLVSSTPDIGSVYVSEKTKLKKGEYQTIQNVQPAGDAHVEERDGRKVYCFPLEAYIITMGEKGKYTLSGGSYEIGVMVPVIIEDPFWGRRRSTQTQRHTIGVKDKTFKIKSLPSVPEGVNFSGSVGQFTVETFIPGGDIFVNEEATAVIVVRGTGMIEEHVLPEYREAFRTENNTKLKSISESRSEAYKKGKMISELQLECTFIPTDRKDVEIGESTFCYFDPNTGKYVVARSEPTEVKVKSSTAKKEMINI